jgi:hypothetical protein
VLSTWLKHVAHIAETNRTLLWLAAVHISELLYQFVCMHSSELLKQTFMRFDIGELFKKLLSNFGSCLDQTIVINTVHEHLHVEINVCIPVPHLCSSFHALCV